MCGSPDENVILNDGKKIDQLIDHYIFESVEKMLSNISLSTFENWYNEIYYTDGSREAGPGLNDWMSVQKQFIIERHAQLKEKYKNNRLP
ncbi:hypothetical protein COT12_00325 [Candidatus Berkelbacteria bacterium CG08_land_8_20_14_0_20_39_8]|uniref:Uncharacterized protein n=1 Tax=Candidatus Berkelbacteria bacterium CG08_land_8_20_14_0_20_39_8 TaxID=1974511 RepID=A0A2M6YD09_9BACT|nr:MAG: hypothetical protein COT12_00325 [Candidatus Berkelbacteria bacterium CG08_land_8_20_14_0_20_39_8]